MKLIRDIINDIKKDPELRRELFEDFTGWICIIGIGFMLAVIGG